MIGLIWQEVQGKGVLTPGTRGNPRGLQSWPSVQCQAKVLILTRGPQPWPQVGYCSCAIPKADHMLAM